MAETFSGAVQPSSIEKSEHIETNNVGAKRVLAVGSDGSNMQDLATDGDGHLQVDVLTGGGGGTLVNDGDAVNAADTGILVLGTDGSNYQLLKTGADGAVQIGDNGGAITVDGSLTVDLGANNDVTVTNATATNLKCEEASASAIKTAVEIMDDWDSGDTCKVSIPAHASRVQGKVDNADTTTAREVLAAVASNYVYITSFVISVAAAGNYWLEDGDAAQITPKFYLAANGGVSWTAADHTPYKTTTVNKAINVKGSTAGAVGVMLTGYTATA